MDIKVKISRKGQGIELINKKILSFAELYQKLSKEYSEVRMSIEVQDD